MSHLLDGNVLVALAVPEHIHHEAVHAWREANPDGGVATCPITQGTLMRLLMREGASAGAALRVLESLCAWPDHEFWSDDLPYGGVQLHGVLGHRQLTDAYLAQLCRQRDGSLLTLDRGLAALHSDIAVLVPTG